MSYALLRRAVLERKQVTASYKGRPREFCPHALGTGGDGARMVLGFQFGGYSSKGLPLGGEWRCFEVALLSNVQLRDGKWHSNNDHSRPNSCVTWVDVSAR